MSTIDIIVAINVFLILLVVSRILWIVSRVQVMFDYHLEKFDQVDFDVRDIHDAVGAKRSGNREWRV